MKLPERITWPGSMLWPYWVIRSESQKMPMTGSPSTPAPRPVSSTMPLALTMAPGPAEVFLGGVEPAVAEDDPGIGGVVGDGVEDAARLAGGGAGALDPGVENLDRGGDVIGGGEHVVARDGALERGPS